MKKTKPNGRKLDLTEDNWVLEQLSREGVNREEIREVIVQVPRQILFDLNYQNHIVRQAYRENRTVREMDPLLAMTKALQDYERRLTRFGYCLNLSFS